VLGPVIEVDEITCADVYRTHTEPRAVRIDAIKINQAFKCASQRRDIVVTDPAVSAGQINGGSMRGVKKFGAPKSRLPSARV
jgi:hypothetical protein